MKEEKSIGGKILQLRIFETDTQQINLFHFGKHIEKKERRSSSLRHLGPSIRAHISLQTRLGDSEYVTVCLTDVHEGSAHKGKSSSLAKRTPKYKL